MIASVLAASDLAAAGEGSAQLPIFLAESHAAAGQQVNSLPSIVKAVLAEALAREEGFKQRGTSRIALPYASFPLPICPCRPGRLVRRAHDGCRAAIQCASRTIMASDTKERPNASGRSVRQLIALTSANVPNILGGPCIANTTPRIERYRHETRTRRTPKNHS
jgi:hypothetical protein